MLDERFIEVIIAFFEGREVEKISVFLIAVNLGKVRQAEVKHGSLDQRLVVDHWDFQPAVDHTVVSTQRLSDCDPSPSSPLPFATYTNHVLSLFRFLQPM